MQNKKDGEMRTLEECRKIIKEATTKKKNFSCKKCSWVGNIPLLVDYDERGPHFDCPACKAEIPN